jgi:hypothetical protein
VPGANGQRQAKFRKVNFTLAWRYACPGVQALKELHMQKFNQRFLLMVIVLLAAAVGVAKQALAQTITEFPVPTAGASPFQITAGPDGALWFTEEGYPTDPNNENIGRITTSGAITEYLPPTYHSGPNSITTGLDGALWFTRKWREPDRAHHHCRRDHERIPDSDAQ